MNCDSLFGVLSKLYTIIVNEILTVTSYSIKGLNIVKFFNSLIFKSIEMKKFLLLGVFALLALVSCKEKVEATTEETTEAVEEVMEATEEKMDDAAEAVEGAAEEMNEGGDAATEAAAQ